MSSISPRIFENAPRSLPAGPSSAEEEKLDKLIERYDQIRKVIQRSFNEYYDVNSKCYRDPLLGKCFPPISKKRAKKLARKIEQLDTGIKEQSLELENIFKSILEESPKLNSLIQELNESTFVLKFQLNNISKKFERTVLWTDSRLSDEKDKIAVTISAKDYKLKLLYDTSLEILILLAFSGIAYQIYQNHGISKTYAEALEGIQAFPEDILRYDRKDPRKKALILRAIDDHNGALSSLKFLSKKFLSEMIANWDVRYSAIGSISQICDEIAYAGQFELGPIVIQAHGWKHGIVLSNVSSLASSNLEDLRPGCFSSLLGIEGPIILDSCSTGAGGRSTFAQRLADKTGLEVIAATDLAIGAVLGGSPLKFSILGRFFQDVSRSFLPNTSIVVSKNNLRSTFPINRFDSDAAIGFLVIAKVGSIFFRSMRNLSKMFFAHLNQK